MYLKIIRREGLDFRASTDKLEASNAEAGLYIGRRGELPGVDTNFIQYLLLLNAACQGRPT